MHFLSRNVKEFFAFNLAPLALVLYQEQRLFLKNAVDVQSAFPEWKRNNISGILKAALSDETKIHELLVTETFNDITYGPEYRTAALGPQCQKSQHKRVNTFDMNDGLLQRLPLILCVLIAEGLIDKVNRDFEYRGYDSKNKEHIIASKTYRDQFCKLEPSLRMLPVVLLYMARSMPMPMVDPQHSEGRLAIEACSTFYRASTLPITRGCKTKMFLKGKDAISWPDKWFASVSKYPMLTSAVCESLSESARRLNGSQHNAVHAMMSKSSQNVITIIRGPPGTGKTSVIVFFV
ncbi:hypothetical protein Ac2012v2_006855 [Leucoagaricus gongylophorus]